MPRLPRLPSILVACCIVTVLVAYTALPLQSAQAASTVTVNAAVTHQIIDGFGASDAFHTGAYVRGDGSGLTAAQSQQIIQLLFSTTSGAGFTIIRHEVGSSTAMVTGQPAGGDGDNLASIEPTDPGGPNATPVYVWDASDPDKGQVWFTQQAMSYNPNITVIADAWSAPAYMKTNGALINGGYLCGVPGAPTCSSGDWRQHYANYLTQYVKFYQQAGITIQYLGFGNEPELSPSYTGMNWDATNVAGSRGTVNAAMPQDIDFIRNYLGPALAAAGLSTKVSCCDATSWANTSTYASGILADSTASSYLGLITGHAYYSSPNGVITSPISSAVSAGKHVWETETSTFNSWSTAWDDGTDASGLQWAQNLWNGLVNANVNGFLYWWFAELNQNNSDNEAFINMNSGNYTVSSRLWAFANYSRFIRPGATRIDATTANSNLKVTAVRNVDGTYAIVVLNLGSVDESVTFSLQGSTYGATATPYLTNASNNTAQQPGIAVSAGSFTAAVPARSLVTYSIPAGGPTVTPCPNCSPTPTPTRTRTPTITPTAPPGLRIQVVSGGTDNSQQTAFHFRVQNTGASSLSGISARLYFTVDGSNAASSYVLEKYYDQSGVTTVSGPTLASGSTYYFTVSYGSTALAAGSSWEYHTSLHLSSWASTYSASNDWWHTSGTLPASYTDWPSLPGYLNGSLAWGAEPGGGGASATPSATSTRTATRSNTPTRTNTPSTTPSRATATRTNTGTPTRTPTRSSTPTFTPTGARPDLVVTSISGGRQTAPSGCILGTMVGLNVTVQNNGQADAAAFVVEVNGNTLLRQSVSGLAAGQSRTLWFDATPQQTNTATVDVTQLVAEGNEDNNTLTVTQGPGTATRTGTLPPMCTPTMTITGTTPTPSRTPTRTPTRSSTPSLSATGGVTCSPVDATITAPYNYDGSGTFCWQASNLGTFINSWNLAKLTVNGVDLTNLYVPVSSLPAKINGYWYISYTGSYPWSHFEAK